jgi:cellulose synthase/poly-beta-1,6-N-acetylglucosamine synthase-like glycosyltransferase
MDPIDDQRPEDAAGETAPGGEDAARGLPELTVLITAHNEEETIQSCLRAVVSQDFPMERVEILLVDDRSTDATVERARQLGLASLRVLTIAEPPQDLTARQAALDLGLREARGEIVLIADADSRVPREWIRDLAGHMSFRDGAVGGPVVYGGDRPVLARFQSIESLVSFTWSRLLHRHGRATGVPISNVAVRRSAYIDSGGFAALGFNPAEGVALAGVLRKGGWSLRFMTEPLVQSTVSGGLVELIGRGRRKARAAAPWMTTLWLFLIVTNLALLGWAAFSSVSIVYGALALAARYGVGLMAIAAAIGQYRAYRSIPALLLFEPLLTYVGTCVYLSLLVRGRWRWADVSYGRSGPAGQPTVGGGSS